MKPTNEQVVQWARESGGLVWEVDWSFDADNLRRFAALAYAAGAADMKELAVNICESEASLEIPNASAAYQQGREIGATVCGVYIRVLGDDE